MIVTATDIVALLGRSHRVQTRLLASVNRSAFTYPVQMESGEVTVDGRSPIRRKLSAVIKARIDDPECDVFRTEIRAQYGIVRPGVDTFWITVGTFVLTAADQIGGGKIAIKGEDRWRRIMNARFLQPTVTSGKHTDAIISLMEGADGRINCLDSTGKTSTHRKSVWDRDRDKAINALSTAIGVDVYFNHMGDGVIMPTPSIANPVALNVGGNDGGTLIDVQIGTSQGNTYNAVVVEGENSSGEVAVRAVAKVAAPDSKLLFGGAFAQRPRFLRSSLISTQLQADNAAKSMLSKVTGISKKVSIDAFPLPLLESGDVILLEVEPDVWERHIVDSFNIPLSLGPIRMSTRTPYEEEVGE